ncbi:MAG: MarR family transcriptional regulator [Nocardiopsaceae bacterium]|nr:MarR family transcriptional regulator [Nocardiopsaceae bacterium]
MKDPFADLGRQDGAGTGAAAGPASNGTGTAAGRAAPGTGPAPGTGTAAGTGTAGAWPGHRDAAGLLAAISAVRRTTRRAVRQAWPGEPLPTSQSELLRLVAEHPGITVAAAARELRLAPNTVSTLVGSLTERGLLSRQRARSDGRTVSLDLTPVAVKRLADRRDLRAELAQQVLVQLPEADQQALASAVPALLRLAEGLAAL